MAKIIVGMSGGVDSSVTAYILKDQGHEVVGVSFILYEARLKNTFTGCCSLESINDAKRTAEQIGISHISVDLRDEFMESVIEPFIDAYSKGVTPNPCILCNKYIKFPYLFKIAGESSADLLSTGHYARVESNQESGEQTTFLKKGVDSKKDQSYVLYALKRNQLNRLKLPLGEKRKDEIRGIAKNLNLPASNRPESQDICFIEDRKYFNLVQGTNTGSEGLIIEKNSGKVLGKHAGLHLYTVGQRKRLGVATGVPLYVVKIDHKSNNVYVGHKEQAMSKEFLVKDINWLIPKEQDFRSTVKVRSTMTDEPAYVFLYQDKSVRVVYNEPQWAPAPGQSAVFYDRDKVIGGGVIQ